MVQCVVSFDEIDFSDNSMDRLIYIEGELASIYYVSQIVFYQFGRAIQSCPITRASHFSSIRIGLLTFKQRCFLQKHQEDCCKTILQKSIFKEITQKLQKRDFANTQTTRGLRIMPIFTAGWFGNTASNSITPMQRFKSFLERNIDHILFHSQSRAYDHHIYEESIELSLELLNKINELSNTNSNKKFCYIIQKELLEITTKRCVKIRSNDARRIDSEFRLKSHNLMRRLEQGMRNIVEEIPQSDKFTTVQILKNELSLQLKAYLHKNDIYQTNYQALFENALDEGNIFLNCFKQSRQLFSKCYANFFSVKQEKVPITYNCILANKILYQLGNVENINELKSNFIYAFSQLYSNCYETMISYQNILKSSLGMILVDHYQKLIILEASSTCERKLQRKIFREQGELSQSVLNEIIKHARSEERKLFYVRNL